MLCSTRSPHQLPSHTPLSPPKGTGPCRPFPSSNCCPVLEGSRCPVRLTFPCWKSRRPAGRSPRCPAARCCPPPPCTGPARPRHSPGARPAQADMLSRAASLAGAPPSPNQGQGLLFSTFPPVSLGTQMRFLDTGATSLLYPQHEGRARLQGDPSPIC